MYSWKRALAIVCIATALGCLLIWQASVPVKQRLAVRYVGRGEVYMRQQEFDLAKDEYSKALYYDPENSAAQEGKRLAEIGTADIAQLEEYYGQIGEADIVSGIIEATAPSDDPKALLARGMDYYAQGKFNYARYPLEAAVTQDPQYADAWHYLYLTYSELAKVDGSYTEKAAQAKDTRDSLTIKYLDL